MSANDQAFLSLIKYQPPTAPAPAPKPKKRKYTLSDYLIWGPFYYVFTTMLIICCLPLAIFTAVMEFIKKEMKAS